MPAEDYPPASGNRDVQPDHDTPAATPDTGATSATGVDVEGFPCRCTCGFTDIGWTTTSPGEDWT